MVLHAFTKTLKKLSLLFLTVSFLISCSEKEENIPSASGRIVFNVEAKISENINGRKASRDDARYVLISLEKENGDIVFDRKEIDLITVGDFFATKSLDLESGNYRVTEFVVVNDDNEAIYITPTSDSEKAKFVSSPLPLDIVVVPDGFVSVPIEALLVEEDDEPSDFGLFEFAILFADPISLILFIEKNGQPETGKVELIGYRDGFNVLELDYEIGFSGREIKLYNNLDSVRFNLTEPGSSEITRTTEDLELNPHVVFTLGSSSSSLNVEIVNVNFEVRRGLATIKSSNHIFKALFEENESEKTLSADFSDVPVGDYSLTVSIYETKYFEDINPDDRTGFFGGLEFIENVSISGSRKIQFNGPDGSDNSAAIQPMWEERFFYSINEPKINSSEIVWSVPALPCEFNQRFIPVQTDRLPEYIYMDYFVDSDGSDNLQNIALLECFDNCDIFTVSESFNALASSNEISEGICEAKDWEIADMFIFLDFGDDEDEFPIFYMRWDTEGPFPGFLENTSNIVQQDRMDGMAKRSI
jgi:hypothetical protein